MKALVYLGPRRMELQEVKDVSPGPGEVAVRVQLSAICGSDLHGFREASARRKPPLIMGHEVVGHIQAAGAGVDPSVLGRRVVVKPILTCGTCQRCAGGESNLCPDRKLVGMDLPGGFAESLVVPASHVVVLRDETPDLVATLVEPLANALHMVSRSVRIGDSVLTIGAGPIGLLAIRLARLAGARRIIAVDSVARRLALAEAQGADVLLEAAADPGRAVLRETSGLGVDVVLDAAGFAATWSLAIAAVRRGGRIEAIGLGAATGPLDYHSLVVKGVTLAGSYACTDHDFTTALALLEDGRIEAETWFSRMPLAEGQRAFEALVDGTELVKVVLEA